jgi:hypothetical protein
MFEALFLDLPQNKYPYIIEGLSKGKAINRAMLLNVCQQVWAKEQGVPDEMLTKSAKAKNPHKDDTKWILEISDSPKRLGRNSPEWMTDLLEKIQQDVPGHSPIQSPEHDEDTIPNEHIFEKWLNNAPAEGESDVDEHKSNI